MNLGGSTWKIGEELEQAIEKGTDNHGWEGNDAIRFAKIAASVGEKRLPLKGKSVFRNKKEALRVMP